MTGRDMFRLITTFAGTFALMAIVGFVTGHRLNGFDGLWALIWASSITIISAIREKRA